MERTLVMCVPMCRCTPLHVTQTKMPRLMDAQFGAGIVQSAHTLLPGFFASLPSAVCFLWWCDHVCVSVCE
jgi:hypothetical protein